MSSIEPAKLKVAELRVELQSRGLDSKGVKAVLIDRLEQALIAEEAEAEANVEEEDEVEEAEENIEDDGAGLEQEALPEAEQGLGEEFGFSADADVQDSDQLLEGDDTGDDGVEDAGGEADDQFLAELDVPQAMEEPEAEAEPQAAVEEPQEVAAEPEQTEEAPKEEQTEQPMEEQQPQTEEKPEGMEQEEAKEPEKKEGEQPAEGEKKEDGDRDKERRRDHENRDRNRFSGRDRSPRRRSPPPVVMEEDDDIPDTQCVFSKYLSDLNLKIGKDGYNACPLSMEGFAYMWGGVKATHGAGKGKVAYECKLDSQADVRHMPPEETSRHVVRIGWSIDATSLQLGEEAFSYGYGGTGKASVNCKFNDFGEKFGVGDVIGAYVDFEGEKPTISYTKNGNDLGVAFTIEEDLEGGALFPHVMVKNISVEGNFGQREEPWFALKEGFSFIGKLSEEDSVRGPKPPATKKDCEDPVAVLIGFTDEWSPAIVPIKHVLEGVANEQTFVTVMRMGAILRGKVLSVLGGAAEVEELSKYLPPPAQTAKSAKLLMMVGLPGSGKTTWSIEACKKNPDKKYYILGTNLIMDKMKVMGLRRQRNYAGRWDKLMELATKCLNRFFEVAARKRRNYILDQTAECILMKLKKKKEDALGVAYRKQLGKGMKSAFITLRYTNVYPSARRRKMRPFEGFTSKAIVLVPTDEEFLKRVEKRTKEEGKDVPDHAVNEMKANFELPEKGVLFDDVDYVELNAEESKTLVDRYRKEGRDAGGLKPRFGDRRPGGGRDFRGGYNDRGGYGRRDDRGGYRSGYDSGDRRGGYRGGYREGGNWNRGGSSGGYGGGRGGGGYGGGSYGGNRGSGGYGGGSYNRGGSSGYQSRGGSSGYGSNYNRNSSSSYGNNQSSGGYGNRQNQGSYNKYGNNQSSYNQNRQSGYNQQSSYGSSGSNYGSNQGYNQGNTQSYGNYGTSNTSSNYNQSGSSSYGTGQQQYGQQQQQTQQSTTQQQQQYANSYQQYQQYYQQNPQYAQQYAQYYSNYGGYGGSGTSQ